MLTYGRLRSEPGGNFGGTCVLPYPYCEAVLNSSAQGGWSVPEDGHGRTYQYCRTYPLADGCQTGQYCAWNVNPPLSVSPPRGPSDELLSQVNITACQDGCAASSTCNYFFFKTDTSVGDDLIGDCVMVESLADYNDSQSDCIWHVTSELCGSLLPFDWFLHPKYCGEKFDNETTAEPTTETTVETTVEPLETQTTRAALEVRCHNNVAYQTAMGEDCEHLVEPTLTCLSEVNILNCPVTCKTILFNAGVDISDSTEWCDADYEVMLEDLPGVEEQIDEAGISRSSAIIAATGCAAAAGLLAAHVSYKKRKTPVVAGESATEPVDEALYFFEDHSSPPEMDLDAYAET